MKTFIVKFISTLAASVIIMLACPITATATTAPTDTITETAVVETVPMTSNI